MFPCALTVAGMNVPSILTFCATERPDPSRVQPVVSTGWIKPDGGMWCTSGEQTWKQWCVENNFLPDDPLEVFTIPMRPETSLLVIDSHKDLIRALDQFGIERPEWSLPSTPPARVLNFEQVAKKFDAIWLTEAGQWETRCPTGWNENDNLYGWDLETVLMLGPDQAKKCLDWTQLRQQRTISTPPVRREQNIVRR